jgi:hypothetical protein
MIKCFLLLRLVELRLVIGQLHRSRRRSLWPKSLQYIHHVVCLMLRGCLRLNVAQGTRRSSTLGVHDHFKLSLMCISLALSITTLLLFLGCFSQSSATGVYTIDLYSVIDRVSLLRNWLLIKRLLFCQRLKRPFFGEWLLDVVNELGAFDASV